jgi:predicted small secreted protein
MPNLTINLLHHVEKRYIIHAVSGIQIGQVIEIVIKKRMTMTKEKNLVKIVKNMNTQKQLVKIDI